MPPYLGLDMTSFDSIFRHDWSMRKGLAIQGVVTLCENARLKGCIDRLMEVTNFKGKSSPGVMFDVMKRCLNCDGLRCQGKR